MPSEKKKRTIRRTSAVCERIIEEMIEGRHKKREACIFSSAAQV